MISTIVYDVCRYRICVRVTIFWKIEHEGLPLLSVFRRQTSYKYVESASEHNIRTTSFCERVINIWNKLPADTDFSPLSKFKRIITSMDFSDYLHCF